MNFRLRPLAAPQLGPERVEALRPERAEGAEPRVDLRQGSRVEGVEAAASVRAHGGEAALAQDLELHRHRRLADAERLRDDLDHVAGGPLALDQQLEDAPAHGVAEDVEGVHQPAWGASVGSGTAVYA